MIAIILDDLRQRFGDKIFLDTEDLAAITNLSRGQNANLRSGNKFPIPTRKLGGRIVVSIYALAKYLAESCEEEIRGKPVKATAGSDGNTPSKPPRKSQRAEKKAQKGLLEADWWLEYSPLVITVLEKCTLNVERSTLQGKAGGFARPTAGRGGGGI